MPHVEPKIDGSLAAAALVAASAGGDTDFRTPCKGILIYINISAISGTTPTLTVTLKGKDPATGNWVTILASAALNATGTTVLRVYPGLTAAANLTANDILPSFCRLTTAVGGTTPSVTATFGIVQVA